MNVCITYVHSLTLSNISSSSVSMNIHLQLCIEQSYIHCFFLCGLFELSVNLIITNMREFMAMLWFVDSNQFLDCASLSDNGFHPTVRGIAVCYDDHSRRYCRSVAHGTSVPITVFMFSALVGDNNCWRDFVPLPMLPTIDIEF